MKSIQHLLTKRLQKQKLIKISSAELALKIIGQFFNKKILWVEKNNILYIKNLNPDQKFKLYLTKKQLLEQINYKLENLWIKKKFKDIRIL